MLISYSFAKNVGGYHLLGRDAVWSHRILPAFRINIRELLGNCTASHSATALRTSDLKKERLRIPYSEDEGIMFLLNVYSHLPNCMVS
jgi:hypothetical protein